MIRAAKARARSFVRDHVGPRLAARRPKRVDLPYERWGLSVGSNGRLWSASVDLEELARTEGTPVHVALGEALDRRATESLAPFRAGHGADIFYSYKTNPVPAVLERLHGNGVGAEVISPYELWLAFKLGVRPERIIYNGPAKSPDSLREAIRRGVLVINANSEHEAALVAEIAAEEQVVASLGLRVAIAQTWGGQFGIAAESEALFNAVESARSNSWVNLCGLHFHRGRTIRDAGAWEYYVRAALAFCAELHGRTGWHPAILDIGGSLACASVSNPEKVEFRLNRAYGSDLLPPDTAACVSIGEASEIASRLLDQHVQETGVERPLLVQEPGRAMTSDTQFLLTTVIDVKRDSTLPFAILDAGINVAEPVRGEFHQLFSVSDPTGPAEQSYRLAGPICTPADVLYNNWRLPELRPGHVLAIMDSGAYFVPFSTTFSFPAAAVVLQDSTGVFPVRRRKTFDALVSDDDFAR
jgi:diaminopimelate decarboxylase